MLGTRGYRQKKKECFVCFPFWIPAYAGMTVESDVQTGSNLHLLSPYVKKVALTAENDY